MRSITIECDFCFYESDSITNLQVDGRDVCAKCAGIISAAALLGLTERIGEAVRQRCGGSIPGVINLKKESLKPAFLDRLPVEGATK